MSGPLFGIGRNGSVGIGLDRTSCQKTQSLTNHTLHPGIDRSITDMHKLLKVASTDPSSADAIPPLSSVPKYEMPVETYSSLPATVLAYKKTHQIGRFDPHAPEWKERKAADLWKEIAEGSMSRISFRLVSHFAPNSVDPGHKPFDRFLPHTGR